MGSSSKWKAIGLLILSACGADETFDCDSNDWKGYYHLTSTTLDGNCGQVDSRTVYIDEGNQYLDAGCIETYESWSTNECYLDRNIECLVMTDAGSMTYKWQGHISQEERNGNTLQARVFLSVTNNNTGNVLCSGTYSFTYVKINV